jgi:hypothetical protein
MNSIRPRDSSNSGAPQHDVRWGDGVVAAHITAVRLVLDEGKSVGAAARDLDS